MDASVSASLKGSRPGFCGGQAEIQSLIAAPMSRPGERSCLLQRPKRPHKHGDPNMVYIKSIWYRVDGIWYVVHSIQR